MADRRWPWCFFLLATVLFSLQVVTRFKTDAPVTDELRDICNGFYCWRGDVTSEPTHPPFGKAILALPLLAMGLDGKNENLGLDPLERQNRFYSGEDLDGLDRLLTAGRWMVFPFGLGIGFLIFLETRKKGMAVVLAALILWAFEPTLLAFSGFAKADVLLAFFGCAFFLADRTALETGSRPAAWAAGILAALAVTSKFSAVAFLPGWLLLEFLARRKRGFAVAASLAGPRGWRMAAGFATVVGLVYLPASIHSPDHHWPWVYFVQGLFSRFATLDNPVYFLGEVSRKHHLLYYPTVLFLKCTLPFLLLLVLGGWFALRRRMAWDMWTWLPGVTFLLAMMPAVNTGIRNLLPAFPFFILMAADAAGYMMKTRGISRFAIAVLLAAHAVGVISCYPSHMSYFNEGVPLGAKIRLLGDSNLDLGQDHRRFAEFAKARGWRDVRFGMFLGESPVRYGLDGRAWGEADFTKPEPGRVYAYNASFIQLAPGYYPEMTVLRDGWWHRAPFRKFMDTWYYLEIPPAGR